MTVVRAMTLGIALQSSPTKEMVSALDWSLLTPRERRALRIAEGRAAMGWAIASWPAMSPDYATLAPGHRAEPADGIDELLQRASALARSNLVLDVPELFGVPPGSRPLSRHRERIAGDGRRRNRVPWSSRRNLRHMRLAMPVGGTEGESPRLVIFEEAPDSEGESSDADRRLGVPYPEWDYRLNRYRQDFVTVVERRISPRYSRNIDLDPRIRRWFMAPHALARRSRMEDGDQLDVSAYVEQFGWSRAGGHVDDRIYEAMLPAQRDVATALLLDATSSLQGRGGAGFRLQLACSDALCAGMSSTAERFAVFAFTGETRHRVEVTRLRNFDDPAWALPAGAAIRPSGYTRLGAALRHVTRRLVQAPAERRVLLSIGDAVPSDEGYEGTYADADVNRAVDEAIAAGVVFRQLAVGKTTDAQLERRFGSGRFHRVSKSEDLPSVLARVHKELTYL
ncbi:nitric oxide reductase activation protein NorD [Mycolicibacterium pulveris]|nr:VWA domain-containing protein [Mycolicibacterium pulveris]